uniref:Uncharacterized protein n=1 Tax=Leviviridae sp. TaxID=2027243 RepID=A0A514D7C1_9VIRU|nr:MAG: hypothetical protein H4Rhizo43412_000002 [Leviviridae sp.]
MRGDYDYHHATANSHAIIIIICIMLGLLGLGGLLLGLTLLTSIL